MNYSRGTATTSISRRDVTDNRDGSKRYRSYQAVKGILNKYNNFPLREILIEDMKKTSLKELVAPQAIDTTTPLPTSLHTSSSRRRRWCSDDTAEVDNGSSSEDLIQAVTRGMQQAMLEEQTHYSQEDEEYLEKEKDIQNNLDSSFSEHSVDILSMSHPPSLAATDNENSSSTVSTHITGGHHQHQHPEPMVKKVSIPIVAPISFKAIGLDKPMIRPKRQITGQRN